ncbi:MAG: hypothetical protein ABJB76_05425 [Candidatus Nitrosocosmicus sp.]
MPDFLPAAAKSLNSSKLGYPYSPFPLTDYIGYIGCGYSNFFSYLITGFTIKISCITRWLIERDGYVNPFIHNIID